MCSDHSALTSIMKQSLDKMPNQRIFNLRDMCKDYNFTTKYVPGGKGVHYLIDQLSRNPLPLEEHNTPHQFTKTGYQNPCAKMKEFLLYLALFDHSSKILKDFSSETPSLFENLCVLMIEFFSP